MALVRILVDGYSLLHHWLELAPQHARHSQAAREELVSVLRLYQDAVGTPVTIVFDGATARGASQPESKPELEIFYTRTGQTADQVIERVVHRMQPYGEVLAVTDDYAERDMVIALGGMASSCENFVRSVDSALSSLQSAIAHHNRRERDRFKGNTR